jgi:hypothetical protein
VGPKPRPSRQYVALRRTDILLGVLARLAALIAKMTLTKGS